MSWAKALVADLKMLHERKTAAATGGLVNHVDSVRFGPDDFLRFSELWEQLGIHDLGQLQAPPRKMAPPREKLLLDTIAELEVEPPPKPAWLSSLVAHRD